MFPFVTGEVVRSGRLLTQHNSRQQYNFGLVSSGDDELDNDHEGDLSIDDDDRHSGAGADSSAASVDIEAVFGNHLGDLAPMENGGQKCLICAKTFTQLGSAKRHVVEVHKPGQQVSCHICHKIFSNSRSGKEHMRVKHGISQKMINLQKKFSY